MVFSWGRFRQRLVGIFHLDEEPARLARSVAAGVFVGLTPFYGLHTFLALLVAFLFGLNKAATITGAWINLPWFAPFVYGFCLALGEAVVSGDWGRFSWAGLAGLVASAEGYLRASPRENVGALYQVAWDMLFTASGPLFVGTTLVGLLLAVIAYYVTLEAILEIRRLRDRRHPARPVPPVPEKATAPGTEPRR